VPQRDPQRRRYRNRAKELTEERDRELNRSGWLLAESMENERLRWPNNRARPFLPRRALNRPGVWPVPR
jgi:hypothetical protein